MAAMKEEKEEEEEAQVLQSISNFSDSPNGKSRRRRRSGGSSGGSFEFCVLRKPNLLSADQLFSDGVLLPIYRIPTSGETPETNLLGSSGEEEKTRFAPELNPPDSSVEQLSGLVSEPDRPDLSAAEQPELVPESERRDSSAAEQVQLEPETDCPDLSRAERPELEPKSEHPDSYGAEQPDLGSGSGPEISAAAVSSSTTSSKRWRDIFKRAPKGGEIPGEKTSKEKKGGIFAAHAAELVLNINIWPFRRSNSAGNGSGMPPAGAALTPPRVISAPCSPAEFNFKKLPTPRKGRTYTAWPPRRSVSGTSSRSNGVLTKSADKDVGKDRSHGDKGYTTKEGGNKGRGKVSPAAGDGGDWYKARVLTMKASMCPDASGSGGDGGVSGVGRRSNLRTLFANKIYEI
ncbi:unnamed protein product [Cuscuta campestris]|uniref:Uncharacterized protein n=1 Tax=Cuscuta campestris TaxID=132261 RepID=A0A484N599_9ASTE|nr:unnamed protein product [Cuscuta campestris]